MITPIVRRVAAADLATAAAEAAGEAATAAINATDANRLNLDTKTQPI